MNKLITGAIVMTTAIAANAVELMQDWDKTFPKSDKVEHAKATFRNRFGITLAADVYKPKAGSEKFAAIAVSGPFGAVKEQSSGLYAGEIEGAVMVLHGEKAHSRYFGEDAFKMLKGDNKELVIVPGAVHCDLYDGGGKGAIPFDKIEAFYKKNLK